MNVFGVFEQAHHTLRASHFYTLLSLGIYFALIVHPGHAMIAPWIALSKQA